MRRALLFALVLSINCLLVSAGQAEVVMEWVVVDDPGNVGELSGAAAGGAYALGANRVCGAVDYIYRIAQYEVTNGQYIEFLQAVARVEDTYGLFTSGGDNGGMDGYYGGIQRLGVPGNYTYRAKDGNASWLDKPVHFVSFYSALRFANWMHNGQPSGPQNAATTEDGAYDMSLGAGVVRRPGARVTVPTEDEWYKAAYYQRGTGAAYWEFPTQSDSPPVCEPPPGVAGPPGSANYYCDSGPAIGPPYFVTDNGAYTGSPGPYGTFGQAGNVHEWTETLEGSYRIIRGGAFLDLWAGPAAARGLGMIPDQGTIHLGFRLAAVFDSVCGNALVEAGEECDDGALVDGDGCSASCDVEPGWQCVGEPSTCEIDVTAIPTVSQWGLVAMTLLIATGGSIVLRNAVSQGGGTFRPT